MKKQITLLFLMIIVSLISFSQTMTQSGAVSIGSHQRFPSISEWTDFCKSYWNRNTDGTPLTSAPTLSAILLSGRTADSDGKINSYSGYSSLNFNSRTLFTASNHTSLNWDDQTLFSKASSDAVSLDWSARQLKIGKWDYAANYGAQYGARSLIDKGYADSLKTVILNNNWNISGNSGTSPGTNFIGTTDAQDMVFKLNSTEVARLGTGNQFTLGVSSVKNFGLQFANSGNNNVININTGLTSATYNLTLPTAQGAASTFLMNNGSGVLSFSNSLGSATATTQSQNDNSTKLSTTAYTDLAVANGMAAVNPAVAVQAATTTTLAAYTYNNGASGIGAFITITTPAVLIVDGYTFTATGQRLLVKNETGGNAPYNGVYYVSVVGSGIVSTVLIRALDYDQPSDINNTGAIPVVNGTSNTLTSWLLTSAVTIVGTDALTYTQFTLSPTATGSGLDVRQTSPTLITPALGTPSSGNLGSCTSIPVANATGLLSVSNGGTGADLSGVGGTNNFVYKATAGAGALTVGTAAASNLSNGTTGSGAIVLATAPTFTTNLTTPIANLSGTSNQLVFQSAGTTGTISWAPSSSNKTITLPNGTTDFTATGGTSKFLKQNSAGAAITIVQPATTDLSDNINLTDYSSTTTLTGYLGTPSKYVFYRVMGDVVYVLFGFSGTSNAVDATFTLPYADADGGNYGVAGGVLIRVRDNGGSFQTGLLTMAGSTCSIAATAAGTGFTASGSKAIFGEFFYTK